MATATITYTKWERLYHRKWHHFVLAAGQPNAQGFVEVWHSEREGITKTFAFIGDLIRNATY